MDRAIFGWERVASRIVSKTWKTGSRLTLFAQRLSIRVNPVQRSTAFVSASNFGGFVLRLRCLKTRFVSLPQHMITSLRIYFVNMAI